jgi:hypothetical protein
MQDYPSYFLLAQGTKRTYRTRIEKGPALPWPFWYLSIKTGGANRKASENTRKGTELHVR